MKRCGSKPYEGNEPYIFISYCHLDRQYVFPLIERLAQKGFRMWYDEGIDPGSEWPEVIARHLSGCAACVAFISENSVRSHNCRREINFALLKKKAFISVFVEKVELSPGMEMQLAASQSLFRYIYDDDAVFAEVLSTAPPITECMGVPHPEIKLSDASEFAPDSGQFAFEDKRESFSDEWFTGKKEEDLLTIPVPFVYEPRYVMNIDEAGGRRAQVVIDRPEFTVGRANCDYIIEGDREISRWHFTVLDRGIELRVIDFSRNGTFLNGQRLALHTETPISAGDEIRVGDCRIELREK